MELTNLMTHTTDGIALVANAGELPSMPGWVGAGLFFTEGHGAWQATGERTVEVTFVFLTLNRAGSLISTNAARATLDVDAAGDAFTGTFALELVSPDGNPMGAHRGALRATRIEAAPTASTPVSGTPNVRTPAVASPAP